MSLRQTRRGFFAALGALAATPAVAAIPEPAQELWTRRYVRDKLFDLPVHLAIKVEDWRMIEEGKHPRYASLDHLSGRLSRLKIKFGDDPDKMPRSYRSNLRRKFKELSNVSSLDS